MRRNTDQENSEYGHFSCSANFNEPVIEEKYQDDKSILVKKIKGTFKAKVALSERPCNWFPVAKTVQKYLQKTVTFTKMTLLCGCLLSIILVQIN